VMGLFSRICYEASWALGCGAVLEDVPPGNCLLLVHTCAYTGDVLYEWDSNKARLNMEKHGIDFADATGV
jgi:hypothetical protein